MTISHRTSTHCTCKRVQQKNILASASSYGGKIRARKRADDAPIVITSASQLQMLIDADNFSSDMSHAPINTSIGTVDIEKFKNRRLDNQHNININRKIETT